MEPTGDELARGSFFKRRQEAHPVLVSAWQKGARFDAWSEHFRLDLWQEAFRDREVDPEFYLHRLRAFDEVLPWDHIQCGVSKEYLEKEWKRAVQGSGRPIAEGNAWTAGSATTKKYTLFFSGSGPLPGRRPRRPGHGTASRQKGFGSPFLKQVL